MWIDTKQLTCPNEYLINQKFCTAPSARHFSHLSFHFSGSAPTTGHLMNESQHILHVISPVPEGGDSELVESYRPVSVHVLPVVAKVFERMMSGPPCQKLY